MTVLPQIHLTKYSVMLTVSVCVAIFSTQIASFFTQSCRAMHSECMFQGARHAYDSKNYRLAEDLLRKSYSEQAMEPGLRMQMSESANNLGVALALQSKAAEAAEKFEEVIAIRQFLKNDVVTAISLYQLAKIRLKMGQRAEAKAFLIRSETIFVKTRGNASLTTIKIRQLLAGLNSNED